jgi:hypothetical protein
MYIKIGKKGNRKMLSKETVEKFKDKNFWKRYCDYFNQKIDGWCSLYETDDFNSFHEERNDKSQSTVQKTLSVEPFHGIILEKVCNEFGIPFKIEQGKGYDYIIDGIQVEGKTTQSNHTGFTGCSHSNGVKVNDFLLIKFKIKNNKLTEIFAALVDMDRMENGFTHGSTENCGFSILKYCEF